LNGQLISGEDNQGAPLVDVAANQILVGHSKKTTIFD
jgi:hypothetical protein